MNEEVIRDRRHHAAIAGHPAGAGND